MDNRATPVNILETVVTFDLQLNQIILNRSKVEKIFKNGKRDFQLYLVLCFSIILRLKEKKSGIA